MSTVTVSESLIVGEEYDPILLNAIFRALTIGAIIGADIVTATILGSNIASATITGTNIAAATISGSNIMADAIGASHIASNTISADEIQTDAITTTKILAGAVTTDKIYAGAITADKISVTTLAAISADLGEVTAGTLTAPTIRTSADPAVNRVIMDSGGIRGYSTTLGQTFSLPTDGSAPIFARGLIQSATIIDTTIVSNDFKSASILPWLEISASGVSFRESGTDSLYGTAVYGTDIYGPTQAGFLFNSAKPILYIEKERTLADIHLYNRASAVPTGACEVGDLCVIGGELNICTGAGTGIGATWVHVGEKPIHDIVLIAGKKLIFDGA